MDLIVNGEILWKLQVIYCCFELHLRWLHMLEIVLGRWDIWPFKS